LYRNPARDKRPTRNNFLEPQVDRIKSLALECKKLSNQSAQTYENLTENPELQALESELQEEKQHVDTLQGQLKALSAVERMKCSHEQCTAQQQIHMLQSKVMEVTQ
jgi:predicted RNase H-like nuclease (RuvC/YqgF family)